MQRLVERLRCGALWSFVELELLRCKIPDSIWENSQPKKSGGVTHCRNMATIRRVVMSIPFDTALVMNMQVHSNRKLAPPPKQGIGVLESKKTAVQSVHTGCFKTFQCSMSSFYAWRANAKQCWLPSLGSKVTEQVNDWSRATQISSDFFPGA